MSDFARALPVTLAYEGGRVDNPADHGGRTNRGITQRVYSAWLAQHGRPDADVFGVSDADVAAIYEGSYWRAIHGDELAWPLNLCAFDAAVNSGPGQAARWLQAAVGVTVDGAIGPATLAACKAADPVVAAKGLNAHRRDFLAMLAQRPGQAQFLHGWLARVADLDRRCA